VFCEDHIVKSHLFFVSSWFMKKIINIFNYEVQFSINLVFQDEIGKKWLKNKEKKLKSTRFDSQNK